MFLQNNIFLQVGISYFNDEKYHYEDHDRFPPKHYDDHNHYNNNYDNYDYIYQEDPKCYSGRSSSSSSSSSYKSENQFHSRAWGTSEYEEPSLTITRVRKQYSSNYNSYNSSLPSQLSHHHNHHDHHNLEINNSINQYYSPWENKHEFEIALNKLDRYYQVKYIIFIFIFLTKSNLRLHFFDKGSILFKT
jgi:hypothetical protein